MQGKGGTAEAEREPHVPAVAAAKLAESGITGRAAATEPPSAFQSSPRLFPALPTPADPSQALLFPA